MRCERNLGERYEQQRERVWLILASNDATSRKKDKQRLCNDRRARWVSQLVCEFGRMLWTGLLASRCAHVCLSALMTASHLPAHRAFLPRDLPGVVYAATTTNARSLHPTTASPVLSRHSIVVPIPELASFVLLLPPHQPKSTKPQPS
jgi:hypothetical protein